LAGNQPALLLVLSCSLPRAPSLTAVPHHPPRTLGLLALPPPLPSLVPRCLVSSPSCPHGDDNTSTRWRTRHAHLTRFPRQNTMVPRRDSPGRNLHAGSRAAPISVGRRGACPLPRLPMIMVACSAEPGPGNPVLSFSPSLLILLSSFLPSMIAEIPCPAIDQRLHDTSAPTGPSSQRPWLSSLPARSPKIVPGPLHVECLLVGWSGGGLAGSANNPAPGLLGPGTGSRLHDALARPLLTQSVPRFCQ